MTEKKYLERGKLIEDLKILAKCQEPYKQSTILGVIVTVSQRPAADVVEVRHGYWKWETKIEPQAQNRLYCSICDNECLSKGNYYVKSKYCPHCGARMDGERKEQT